MERGVLNRATDVRDIVPQYQPGIRGPEKDYRSDEYVRHKSELMVVSELSGLSVSLGMIHIDCIRQNSTHQRLHQSGIRETEIVIIVCEITSSGLHISACCETGDNYCEVRK